MRPYEVMVILNAGLEEDAIRGVLDQSTKLISQHGGTPGRIDRWGKRQFSYEVNHRTEGYYVVIEATAPPAAMAELERMLHLADDVIRHKVTRIPDHVAGRASGSAGSGPRASGGSDPNRSTDNHVQRQ